MEEIEEARLFGIALKNLSQILLNINPDERPLSVMFGNFAFPSVSKRDMYEMVRNIHDKLMTFDEKMVDPDVLKAMERATQEITFLQNNVVPNIYVNNQNGINALNSFIHTISAIDMLIDYHVGWSRVPSRDILPKSLSKKLASIDAKINEIIPEIYTLEAKAEAINDASEAADSLPTDLEELRKARDEIKLLLKQSSGMMVEIEEKKNFALQDLATIGLQKKEADTLVAKCDEAYRITTTHGLAASFDGRANELKNSVWIWVFGLVGALSIGFLTGSNSIEKLSNLSSGGSVGAIIMHIIFAIISVGGSIWFAWLSTKQIGQRFKLAEDYAFKASVAKAYEGYRKEAVRIDPLFEARLFASALTRLEEAPLRLVEDDQTHGSPWHELFASEGLKKAIEIVPELKKDLIELLKGGKQKASEIIEEIENKSE